MRRMKNTFTPGGARLRALRETRGLTQLAVELEASLGTGYLQRLELGKVQQPQRETLERILAVLDVHFAERCTLLSLFGYTAGTFTPDDAEIQWATSVFRSDIEPTCGAVPAYLLDCSHRLLAWNGIVPKLFGAEHFTHRADYASMPRLIFDPAYRIAPSIVNADEFFPAQVRAIRYERQRSCDEAWYGGFVDDMRRYPTFNRYWTSGVPDRAQVPMRPLAPLVLNLGDRRVHFRLISEPFVQDYRFRVIYFLPADVDTIQQCGQWHKESTLL